jgi:DNA-binding Xre family transcriptional regulator
MLWNLRLAAAERGIWKAVELRRRLAEAGLEMSKAKMSGLWAGTPISVRLDDLDVICAVLDCGPGDLLIAEPDEVAAGRRKTHETGTLGAAVSDRASVFVSAAPPARLPRRVSGVMDERPTAAAGRNTARR